MTAVAFHEAVTVRGRFYRSVQIAKDWKNPRSVHEYLLTPTARDLATQMLAGLQIPGGSRAWSITGPYGTGKSAFALFLTDLLAQATPEHPQSYPLRQSVGFDLPPFLPMLCVGQRAPLVPTIMSALREAVEPVTLGLTEDFDTLYPATADSAGGQGDHVLTLVESAARASRARGYGGLLLVIDEFGKLLEHASQHPESEDLLVMQHLAEAAARSTIPILLVTILHASFADYLDTLDDLRRREWQKVQGRFTDVAFQEPPEQLLRLVGAAIGREMPTDLETSYIYATEQVVQAPPFGEVGQRFPALGELLANCAPLHPVTALLLWPLFRSKLAQNERSLFAFLTGREPFGFQQFLAGITWSEGLPPFYRSDDLYDYVTTALGAAIYRGDRARRWSEIENALERVTVGAPRLATAVIKTVGLLNLYGAAVGLKASQELIALALGNREGVNEAIAHLQRASILVYRRHEDAYALWEGSDVDLDTAIQEALQMVGHGRLAERLKASIAVRPLVARSHYIKRGTLRYFSVDLIDGDPLTLRQTFNQPLTPADGQILYVLTPADAEREALIKYAQELTFSQQPEHRLRILAFPRPMTGLEEALREVESWEWVTSNVPGLQGDPVARQEVKARLRQAIERLESLAGSVLGLRGYSLDVSACEWVQGGTLHELHSARSFSQWISKLCDQVYNQAPVLRNELLNRDHLSSSAAKARRNLLEAMLSREGEPTLGFTGNPPEVSMYRSLLQDGGFHGFRGGRLQLGEPNSTWLPVWHTLNEFLQETHSNRRPILEIASRLRRAPFGLREGVVPLLTCALLLAHKDDVALYDGGVFVPELRVEVIERLLRVPEAFEIQQFVVSDEDRQAFADITDILETVQGPLKEDDSASQLLGVVKPLVLFAAHLPQYAKNTKKLEPPQAVAVRDILLRSADPYALLFVDLPRALGLPSLRWDPGGSFASLLKDCLLALQHAYHKLLDQIEEQVRIVFDLQGSSDSVRSQLQRRAAAIEGTSAEQTLTLFIRESSRLEGREWREVLGRVVNQGTPPNQWRDPDAVGFGLRLRQIASDFVRLEELVTEQQLTGATQVLRIGLLNGHIKEARAIVALTPERVASVDALTERISTLLSQGTDGSEEARRVRIAALAQAAMRYLGDMGDIGGRDIGGQGGHDNE